MTRRTLDETLAFVTRVEQAKAAADVASIVIRASGRKYESKDFLLM